MGAQRRPPTLPERPGADYLPSTAACHADLPPSCPRLRPRETTALSSSRFHARVSARSCHRLRALRGAPRLHRGGHRPRYGRRGQRAGAAQPRHRALQSDGHARRFTWIHARSRRRRRAGGGVRDRLHALGEPSMAGSIPPETTANASGHASVSSMRPRRPRPSTCAPRCSTPRARPARARIAPSP